MANPNPSPATRIPKGANHPDGTIQSRGPDRRPRRLVRNILLAALAVEGPVVVERRRPNGKVERTTVKGRHAAAYSLLVAIQQITGQGLSNPNAVLRLLELMAEQVDGRPMPPGGDGGAQRRTTFVLEGQEDAPGSVADVVDGSRTEPADDGGFERME